MEVHLESQPSCVLLPQAPWLYLEKLGPFMQSAPLAWREFEKLLQHYAEPHNIEAKMGLRGIDKNQPGNAAYIYQAGAQLKKSPSLPPQGVSFKILEGGAFARFLLQGSYEQLPYAYPQIFEILAKKNRYQS